MLFDCCYEKDLSEWDTPEKVFARFDAEFISDSDLMHLRAKFIAIKQLQGEKLRPYTIRFQTLATRLGEFKRTIVADIDVSGPSGGADAGATGGTTDEAGRILLNMGRSAEALGGSPMAWAAHGEGSEVTGGVSDGGSDPGAFQPMDGPP